MTVTIRLAACSILLAAVPAFAASTLIDFEGTTSFQSVADYYNGGSDGAGQAGGSNFGLSFTGAALALRNDALGPYFSNAPTPGTVMFASDATAALNVAQGFIGELSFYYSALTSSLNTVTVFSGLNGTGPVLGSINLAANAQQGGCADSPLCNWQRVALSFGGTARSVGFGGNAGNVAFDNIAITPIPEPASYALLLLGLAGMAGLARARRR